MEPVLAVTGLRKTFGALRAVDDISFEVRPGEIVGLVGPNGAGKTTTINMILGVLQPTAGGVTIDGVDLARHRSQALAQTNFAATYAPLPGNLSVQQNLRVFGMIYGVAGLTARIEALLAEYDLVSHRATKTGVLSSGEQTRVTLAKAMLNSPKLLLLDEPTASIDPATAQRMRRHIVEAAEKAGAGILWTSHNMYEVAEVCDRVLFMSRGRVLLAGEPAALVAEHKAKSLEALFISVANEALEPQEQAS
ncbi:MAG: transporter, ATPase subunit [Phenylobacterium sp.]|jgi:ABC-2 type transport system ATP-binding protein|nr:transporter, ATPase subunit [Phenylobacterium sp.]